MIKRSGVNLQKWARFQHRGIKEVVKAATLKIERDVKAETPVDTGRLRNGWQNDIRELEGHVVNNVEYAIPVCYGEDLPPSWDERYAPITASGTIKGFPDHVVQKVATTYVPRMVRRILNKGKK